MSKKSETTDILGFIEVSDETVFVCINCLLSLEFELLVDPDLRKDLSMYSGYEGWKNSKWKSLKMAEIVRYLLLLTYIEL